MMQPKNDEQTKQLIKGELKWDSRTWNLGIELGVSENIVILTGVIPSYA